MTQYSERQLQIIHESIKLISKRGILGLTIKNIAEAIGISEPGIYRHFENKSAIIQGIISILSDSFDESTIRSKEMNTLGMISSMFNSLTTRFIENPSLTAIIFSEELFNDESDTSDVIVKMVEKKQGMLINVISGGQAAGEIRSDLDAVELSLIIIGSFRFLVTKWHLMEYSFSLVDEVNKLLKSISIIIKS